MSALAAITMTAKAQQSAEPESMRKLRGLRDKIGRELDAETKARQDHEARPPIVPLSLAADYSTTGSHLSAGAGPGGAGGSGAAPTTRRMFPWRSTMPEPISSHAFSVPTGCT